ncbi:bifunctional DNA primase/polymerase [Aliiroseovarius sp. Z3]|uniref:bifunctional DNA primase/polymerase n=1 Tax=Aliiroseovarius sp. Z3 TaxID=2811402 RepID=UPI0023B22380|nr:bifunctional DNA primase/polymerase [Aliiroseovarius sp. Z3]MDE9449915.1 bifunctional DNA primase/polymerase [Aliiroseovarius sp. Z3]
MRKAFRFEGDMLSSSVVKAALAWARKGGKIVVLHGIDDDGQCTCGRADCKSSGKHPVAELFPKGQHSATSSAAKIRRAFKKYSRANFGVILSPGLVVLDVDGPKGAETFKKLNLPPTLSVRTGRGTHYYFRATVALPKKKAHLPGIDIKDNASGYLVGAPSMHKCGRRYRVRRGKTPVATLPADFVQSLAVTGTRTARFDAGAAFKAGGRNNELTKIAGSLRFRGLTETAIAGALQAINAAACSPPLDVDEVEGIASSVARYDAGHENAFGWLGEVEESEPQFLAYPYIVKGAITVLDGNMGQGKSTFTCAVAAAVTTGEPPPFVDEIEQGTVLFMSAEDDPSRVLKPRLMKAGADVSKVRYQDELFTLDERGLALVRRELTANTPALVIIDPIIAFMQEGANGNNAAETMHFMMELDQLARDFDTAILIVRHLRKARADHVMHQGIGSIAISARVRSGLILAPHPDDSRRRAIVHAKSNYSETGPAIVFEMQSEGPRTHPKIVWHPCDKELTAAELLAPPEAERGRPSKERDTATAWLESVLRKGPVRKKVLDGMADANGITMATLRRAGDTLGIVKSKDGKASVWALP